MTAILEGGFPHILKIHMNTPDDVCRWLKSQANQFFEGSAWTIVEALEDTKTVNESWSAFKKGNADDPEAPVAFTRASCPSKGPDSYDQRKRRWVEESTGMLHIPHIICFVSNRRDSSAKSLM